MDEDNLTIKQRERRALSVAAMMLVVSAIGIYFGWVRARAEEQRKAVAAILKSPRAIVQYDWQKPMPRRTRPEDMPKPPGPKWLREALGPDVFDTATSVYLSDPDDAVMGHVARLAGLNTLIIGGGAARFTASGQSKLSSLGRLEHLRILSRELPEGLPSALEGATHLKEFRCHFYAPNDREMASLAKLSDLEWIEFDGNRVTDAGFAHLSSLKRLTNLNLRGCRVSSLAPLAGLADLEVLECPRSYEDDRSSRRLTTLAPLVGLSKLRRLILNACPIDDAGFAGIERLTALELLSVGDQPTDASLARFATLPKLASLGLRGSRFTAEGLSKVVAAPALTDLFLHGTAIRDLGSLAPGFGHLEVLRIGETPLTDDDLQPLRGATRLRAFSLTGTGVTGAGLSHLAGLTGLKNIDMIGAPIDDGGLAAIATLTPLQSLNLIRPRITDAGLPSLAALTGLRTLILRDAPITDAAVPSLAKLTSCRTFTLSGTRLTPEGIDRLRKATGKPVVTTPVPTPR